MAPIGRHVSQAQRLEEGFGSMSEMAVKRMRERWDMALRAIGTTQGRTLRMQCATCCMGSDPARWPG